MRFLHAFLVIGGLLTCRPAFALDEAVKTQAQAIIGSQLQAFERDDASAAYEFAAPTIKMMFPEADFFLMMVKRGYPPVYRHQSFEFGEARESEGKFAQSVRIIDAEGVPWEALYTLERQPDGSWKINGCVLLKSPDLPA